MNEKYNRFKQPDYGWPTKNAGGRLVPVIDHLPARIVKAIDCNGWLDQCDFHQCQTVHCTAGWIQHIGGLQAADEDAWGMAELIWDVSCPGVECPRFADFDLAFDHGMTKADSASQWNAECLANLRRLAALDPLPEEKP